MIIVLISDYKDGFGGQFGVQADRVDKSALGWEHHEKLNKHESQKDYAKGKKWIILEKYFQFALTFKFLNEMTVPFLFNL